jgi:hypothetical protein
MPDSPKTYRIRPRLWMALPVVLLLWITVNLLAPLPIVQLVTDNPDLIWIAMLANIVVVVGVFVPVFAALGWLRPTLFEPKRVRNLPLMILALSPTLAYIFWVASGTLAAPIEVMHLIVLSALQAAIWEEFIFRGAAVFLLRTRLAEIWVALLPALFFGAIHFLNDPSDLGATLYQVIFAFVVGLSYYGIRRVTGSIFIGIALHFLNNVLADSFRWDEPLLFTIGTLEYYPSDVALDALLLVSAIAALVIAVKYPRVPVLPESDFARA